MFHHKSDHVNRLLTLLDVANSMLVYLLVLHVYVYTGSGDVDDFSAHLGFLVFVTAAFVTSRQLVGLLGTKLPGSAFRGQFWGIVRTMVVTFLLIVAAIFLFKLDFLSRLVLIGFIVANAVVMIGIRAFLHWWYFVNRKEKPENYLRVLIIGSGRRAHLLARALSEHSEWGINVVGFLDPDDPKRYNNRKDDLVMGHVDRISEVLRTNVIEEIIIAVPRSMLGDLQSIVDSCQEEGVKLRYMADFYDFQASRVRLSMVENIPLLSFEPVARDEKMLIVKRLTDLVLVLAALPILLPVFLLAALAVRIDSPGPAFFTQERIGFHKRRFKLYKFRTMVVNAEDRMAEVEHLNEADGPNFKIANDPRVTRVGRFLRKSSIDELPQLFNVLSGDMSLVGPRPMSIRDVDLFDKGIQRKRFSVRPGITCLWQISGRSDLSFDEWLELDLKYIDSWSLGLDLRILFMTVPTVLRGGGAV